jgi:hypothetical protein
LDHENAIAEDSSAICSYAQFVTMGF